MTVIEKKEPRTVFENGKRSLLNFGVGFINEPYVTIGYIAWMIYSSPNNAYPVSNVWIDALEFGLGLTTRIGMDAWRGRT